MTPPLARRLAGWAGVVAVAGGVALSFIHTAGPVCLASYHTSLDGRNPSQRHNAELAVRKLNRVVIGPHQAFSFNTCVGSFSRDAGYRRAPVSYNGQLIDAWGGGVCQASTTLYNAALLSGLKILERNHHHFAPGYVPVGLDAAVAYSNIDLRFLNPYDTPIEIRAVLDAREIRVSILGEAAPRQRAIIVQQMQNRVDARLFQVGFHGSSSRVRNRGKSGYDVTVYRITGNKKEVISTDHYPAIARVVDSE